MKIGFSVILDTTNEEDVQKLARVLSVFASESSTVKDIVVSRAVKWEVDNAVTSASKVQA